MDGQLKLSDWKLMIEDWKIKKEGMKKYKTVSICRAMFLKDLTYNYDDIKKAHKVAEDIASTKLQVKYYCFMSQVDRNLILTYVYPNGEKYHTETIEPYNIYDIEDKQFKTNYSSF